MVSLMRTNMTPSLKLHVRKSALLGRTPGRFLTDVGTVGVDGGTRTLAEAGSDRHGHAKDQFSPNFDLRLSPQLQSTQTTFKTCDLYIIVSTFSSSIY
jgi:hypothetical protein